MSSDFQKVLVLDDRLKCTDKINFAVMKGGQNMTVAQYQAISLSTSQLSFNIQVPSLETVIDRRVMMNAQFTITVSGTVTDGGYLVNYGQDSAFAPFPLHQLFSTAQIVINNNTTSLNVQDCIDFILRSNDQRELNAYNSMTPVAYDTYRDYADAVLANNNPLAGYSNVGNDPDFQPRGAYWITSITGNTVGNGAKTVAITINVTEPLLVSPFIFADPKSNNQGMYGVQVLNAVFNIGGANRVFRSSNADVSSVALTSVSAASLILNYLTPQPSQLLPKRNVVPYYELPRYIQQISSLPANSSVVSSNTITLNQIPDKLMVCVRKRLASKTAQDPDCFIPITGIQINWNNQSGILSSATTHDLYRYSRESGWNGNWNEWRGYAHNANPLGGSPVEVLTCGGILMLEFGKHIQLNQDYYAPSSTGQYVLQFNLTVNNTTGGVLTDQELVICVVNSGCYVVEQGTSSIFTGILTKQDVLDASEQEPYSRSDVKRMIGGGWLDSLKSLGTAILPIAKTLAPVGKAILGQVDHPLAKGAVGALNALGMGQSGGKLRKRVM